ncbi:MAG: hypothetical protein ACKO1F_13725 [Flammeovirgaceae bacterium]
MKKITLSVSLFVGLLFFTACNEKDAVDRQLSTNEILSSKLLNSTQLSALGIAKSSLNQEVLVNDMPDGSKRVIAKYKNEDLKFVLGKFSKDGDLIVSTYVEIIPLDKSVKTYNVASDNFENGNFNGEIVIRPYRMESLNLAIKDSKQTNKLSNARSCGFGQAFYDIGGMGIGSKIGCFIGLIGCLAANYVDCLFE